MDKVIGATGATGATGAQGEPGEIGATGPAGPAPTLTFNPVVTGAAGTDPSLDVTGGDGAYTLTFTIPEGPTGPTGNGLAAYGGLYDNTDQDVALTTAATPVQVPIANPMALSNVDATANTITVEQAGDYAIDYTLTLSSAAPITDLEFAVRQNETDIPASVVTDDLAATTPRTYTGSVIVNLPADADVDIALTDPAGGGTVTVSNVILSVKKLDATTTPVTA